jgi:hypothetical protein
MEEINIWTKCPSSDSLAFAHSLFEKSKKGDFCFLAFRKAFHPFPLKHESTRSRHFSFHLPISLAKPTPYFWELP